MKLNINYNIKFIDQVALHQHQTSFKWKRNIERVYIFSWWGQARRWVAMNMINAFMCTLCCKYFWWILVHTTTHLFLLAAAGRSLSSAGSLLGEVLLVLLLASHSWLLFLFFTKNSHPQGHSVHALLSADAFVTTHHNPQPQLTLKPCEPSSSRLYLPDIYYSCWRTGSWLFRNLLSLFLPF